VLPVFRTPLVRLSNLFPGREVHAKCEHLAPSGCFKIRGAAHLLEHLRRQGAPRHLVVPSMGNTALGVAVGARAFGFSVTGVVPATISRAKDEKLQALGVELIKLPVGGSELLRRAKDIAAERGGYFVHPHLDPLWTDGYQAIAEEVLARLPACRSLVFPLGGGGLLMGLTEWLVRHPAPVRLFGCEAYNYPTYARYDHARCATIADGLLLDDPHLAVQKRIEERGIAIHLIKDSDIRAAMAGLYDDQGLLVEPSSAITAAFVQWGGQELEEPVCVVLTGENITREDFHRLIAP
jgi:threonine dehydratase